jgi:hypothetical protein
LIEEMTRLLLIILPLLILLVGRSNARIDTYVNIHVPASLHKEGGYQHRINHFGLSPIGMGSHRYGGSLALKVYRADSDLCEPTWQAPTTSTTTKDPTTGRNATVVSPLYMPPYMLLTHRGNCTFVTKARHAQQAGAAGLLITDDRCLCADDKNHVCNATAEKPCQEEMPVVANDGSGHDISIPMILLKPQDGTAIDTALHTNNTNGAILLDIRWHPHTVTQQEDPVSYGMWVDLLDNHTAPLMQQIKPVALSLAQHNHDKAAQFYPSFMFVNGSELNCLGNIEAADSPCYQMCTNNGRYCYPSRHVHGTTVVKEILHRICIWKHHGAVDPLDPHSKKDTGTEAWWDYVTYFDQYCMSYWRDTSDKAASELEKCIDKAYKDAKIKGPEVEECIRDSGRLDGDEPNVLLEEQLQSRQKYGVYVAPTVWADGSTFHWEPPTATTILRAICTGFTHPIDAPSNNKKDVKVAKIPDVCQKCSTSSGGSPSSDQDVIVCAQKHGGAGSRTRARHVARTFFWVVFSLAIVGGIGYVVYQRMFHGGARGGQLGGALSNAIGYALLSDQTAATPDGGSSNVRDETVLFSPPTD